ncbi:DUF4362 domain-containing protein [Paenibacillus filicis]|uniref:DUF4362 domain-containing protein n=1 Tax=Paenibacillus filicis TaxID=669464 RepID=A0ABU9DH64_9BACL
MNAWQTKRAAWLLLAVIAVLAGALTLCLLRLSAPPDNDILTRFNAAEINRLNQVADRFQRGHGDNVMLIQTTIDSGPIIHDIQSTGGKITWTVDTTRDAWSGTAGKTTYTCRSFSRTETKEHYTYELSRCEGYGAEEVIPVFGVAKVGLSSILREMLN